MRHHFLPSLAAALLLCSGALAQGIQNQDLYSMFGAVKIPSQTIPGSTVTLSAETGMTLAVGYGYQLLQRSAASLWLDLSPGTFALGGLGTPSIGGSVDYDLQAFTAAARIMVPLQSRVSVFGALGGGGAWCHRAAITGDSNPIVTSHSTLHSAFLVSGGIDVRLTRKFSLRAELRDIVTGAGLSGATGRQHVLPLFGIALHF